MSKRGNKIRMFVGVVLIVAASLGVWVHFARQTLAKEVALAEARATEEANKRYPVKGRRTKERVAPLPPAAAVDLTERPRIRVRKADE